MWWRRIFARRSLAKEVQQALETAVGQLRAGDKLAAKKTAHAAVTRVAAEVGEQSPLYAKALFEEAMLLAFAGDLDEAVATGRTAAAVPAADHASQKERLSHLMNLGEVLTEVGKVDEAERVLRQSLQERRTFYGTDHPGYAWGLSSLAETLYAAGRSSEALPLIEQAGEINFKARQEKVADDMALRAFIVKAAKGLHTRAFETWEQWPPVLPGPITQRCLERARTGKKHPEPAVALEVLQELLQRLEGSSGVDRTQVLQVSLAVADLARMLGDHAARVQAMQTGAKLCCAIDDRRRLVEVHQGLALALSDAGRPDEAAQAYEAALEDANRIGDRALAANVLRNHAIWLDEKGHPAEADELHRRAVEQAAASGNTLMHGRALGAYGIFLHHRGDTPQARAILQKAAPLLPASEPDNFCVENHLQAIRRGQSCECESGEGAMAAIVLRMLQERAPKDLVQSVTVKLLGNQARPSGDQEPNIGVTLSRKPTDAEAAQLNQAMGQVVAELREQYGRAGYSREG